MTVVTGHVSAVELAARLGTSGKQFRAWLRTEADNGHELLQGHQHGDNWVFTSDQADQLAAEYREGAQACEPLQRRAGRDQPW